MKIKKLKNYISVMLIFMLLAAAATYAASMYRISYVERFETGKVDIRIKEISERDTGDDSENQILIEANKDLSYVPRIINRAADCYIRAKIEVNMDGDCERPLNLEDIYGINKDWLYRGDYFYYTKILEQGQQVDLFEGLHVPEEWEYGEANGLDIKVRAEAIQSTNFKPDFNCNLPWGAVELNAVATASGNQCVEATPLSVISEVEYDSSGGFQCETSELFDGFAGIMPGDCCEKTVKVKNSAGYALKTTLNIRAEENQFNEKMTLKIFCDKREIFSGTVSEAGRVKDFKLEDIPKGKTSKVKLQVCLPFDADNDYAEKVNDIVWELNAEEIPDENVQTGDYSKLIPYVVIAAFALLMMLCAAARNRKDSDEANN